MWWMEREASSQRLLAVNASMTYSRLEHPQANVLSVSTGRCTAEWRPTAASCVGRASWTASVCECICCPTQVNQSNQPQNQGFLLPPGFTAGFSYGCCCYMQSCFKPTSLDISHPQYTCGSPNVPQNTVQVAESWFTWKWWQNVLTSVDSFYLKEKLWLVLNVDFGRRLILPVTTAESSNGWHCGYSNRCVEFSEEWCSRFQVVDSQIDGVKIKSSAWLQTTLFSLLCTRESHSPVTRRSGDRIPWWSPTKDICEQPTTVSVWIRLVL